YRHSGHIGNLRRLSLSGQRSKNSTKLVYHAVRGMLPKNKLRPPRLARLKVYAGAEHPHQPQTPTAYDMKGVRRVSHE
ncbi:uL13 family ribosomal protein, partial [Candidatus Saccharibacteria bacterium]|nr:uL13 family ribosomal protein [Candidatus Saccharibacteria bacterium]